MPTSLTPTRESSSIDSSDKLFVTPDLSRLPRTVKPKRYELKLNVEPEQYSYTGQVNIRIFVGSEPVPIIWLHSVGLTIHEASIQLSQLVLPVPSSKIINVPKYGCIGIKLASPLQPQVRAWLCLKFSGEISKNLEGFFSTPYVDSDGKTRLGASTMLAPTEARTFFPCFDEPDLKSVFAIETTVDEDLLVLSNMMIIDQRFESINSDCGKRKRTDLFQWSKEMSTYLVCLVIGKYDELETVADNRTTVRVYTPWGQREQGKFALEVARKSLEYFNGYFGKRYPLTKLDIVALSRLSVGAMENWGLITCRETGLIVDPNDTTQDQKQKIATLIAHEISHQWFGNLVTMKWWDFIYLNEGFATLMQYLCIDKVFPEFDVFNHFCTDTVVPAMGLDALQNSHPVEVPLKDPSEISQVFDKITYCKGASVLHMLHEYLGEEDFKTGIQNYIQQFSYGNATTEDLWKHLSSASDKNVGAVMHSWIRELGFPIVYVSFEPSPDEKKDGVTLKFRQERFTSYSGCDREMLWSIPLKGIYMKNGVELQHFSFLFDKKTAHINLEGFEINDPGSWVKINPKLTGFYRVHYCEQLINRLFENLESSNLTSIDRMGMLDDQVAMVLSDSGSTVRILQLIEKLRFYEKSITVWRSVAGILHQIRSLIWPNEDLADRFDNFCINILRPMLDQLGLYLPSAKEPTNNEQCRGLLFSMMAALGDSRVLSVAKDLFKQQTDNGIAIPACMREAVYKAVMVQGTRSTLEKMKSLYRLADLAEERSVILSSLGYCKDPNVLSEVLEFAISSDVAPQESLIAIITVASNRYGYRLAWYFFTKNIRKFLDRYSGGLFLLSRIIRGVTEGFCDPSSFEEVSNFFQTHRDQLVGNDQAVHQAEEHIRLHMTWRDKDLDQIRHFLDHYVP